VYQFRECRNKKQTLRVDKRMRMHARSHNIKKVTIAHAQFATDFVTSEMANFND